MISRQVPLNYPKRHHQQKPFRLLLSFSSLPRTTFPHKLHNDDGTTMRNNKEMMKLESLLVSKRKRVKKLVLSMWV